jgi:hypothetical protein
MSDRPIIGVTVGTPQNPKLFGGYDIFIAEYDKTSYEEIKSANEEGKIVLCRYTDSIAHLVSTDGKYMHFTCHTDECSTIVLFCSNKSEWSFRANRMATEDYVDDALKDVALDTPLMVFEGTVYNMTDTQVFFDPSGLTTKYGRELKVNDLILFGSKLFVLTSIGGSVGTGSFVVDLKGVDGNSGVYVGADEPDESYDVWINPNGEGVELPTGGEWVLVKEFVLEEDVRQATITGLDIKGEILIQYETVASSSNTKNGDLRFFFNNYQAGEVYAFANSIYSGVKIYGYLWRNLQDGWITGMFDGVRYGDIRVAAIGKPRLGCPVTINSVTLYCGDTAAIMGAGTVCKIYGRG